MVLPLPLLQIHCTQTQHGQCSSAPLPPGAPCHTTTHTHTHTHTRTHTHTHTEREREREKSGHFRQSYTPPKHSMILNTVHMSLLLLLLATVDCCPVKVVGDLCRLPSEMDMVRGSSFHPAHCHCMCHQPAVTVESQLDLLCLPRGQDVKDLGEREELIVWGSSIHTYVIIQL